MQDKKMLRSILHKINNKSYKAYKELQKQWYDYGDFQIGIPHVQGDPFASPSTVFLRINQDKADFPNWLLEKKIRCIAVEDYLTRIIAKKIKCYCKGKRGSGKSGRVNIASAGQEVIERTSIDFKQKMIEVRLQVGLPAHGRRVLGFETEEIFFIELPQIVQTGLFYSQINANELEEHVKIIEDQETLRNKLKEKGLVAFVANNSILPRRSGIDDRPLKNEKVVPFISPKEYEVEFNLPYHGNIKGMGIKKGITLIVGGGYHGKSTLLNALEVGVYNHIPGDGREYVVTSPDAFKIRSEDGRRIERVDISPFINNLPQKNSTKDFSTDNASGSTSQSANIIEALEMGIQLLLIDEDTCATNFMIRDARMQLLVSQDKEPITPFIDKIKPLFEEFQVSTIIVAGGIGDYFDVADQVIMMDDYKPIDVTDKVKEIAKQYPSKRKEEVITCFGKICCRYPLAESIDPRWGRNVKVRVKNKDMIQFGKDNINLSHLEQLVNIGQTKAIADLLFFGLKNKIIDEKRTIKEILELLFSRIDKEGLKIISPYDYVEGDYVKPRLYEVGAALNRLRSLKIKKISW